jgi:hypothetical protein
MDNGWPKSRTYSFGSLANWLLFLGVVAFLSWGTEGERLPQAAIWALVLLLVLSVSAQFIAAYRLIARQDEYLRAITAKRVIAAIGITITAAVFYGLAEQFLGLRQLPMWLVYPFFWSAFGIATPFIRDSRP